MAELFEGNALVGGLWKQYLTIIEGINTFNAKYNVKVSDDAYTPNKAYSEAVALSKDASAEVPQNLLKALAAHQTARERLEAAKTAVANLMSELTGKSLSSDKPVADDDEKTSMRAARAQASNIVKSINEMATLVAPSMPDMAKEINDALNENPLPFIGSGDAVWSPTQESTPKYRTNVSASVEGEVKFSDVEGFTKASMASKKLHPDKDKAPGAGTFRTAWEAVGNKPKHTVQATVEFTHDGVTYTITERPKKG